MGATTGRRRLQAVDTQRAGNNRSAQSPHATIGVLSHNNRSAQSRSVTSGLAWACEDSTEGMMENLSTLTQCEQRKARTFTRPSTSQTFQVVHTALVSGVGKSGVLSWDASPHNEGQHL